MSLLNRLTRGRPMERVRYAFPDVLTGRRVHYYRDEFGRLFMATSRWGLFRVRCTDDRLPEDRVDWSNPDTGRRAKASAEVCDGLISVFETTLLLEASRSSHAAAEGFDL